MTAGDEHGWTLIELMVAATLMLIVLGATLTTFGAFVRTASVKERQNDAAETVRQTLDNATRQLRNLASPTANAGGAATIDTALPYDFIFQTSDPSKTWVRYCLFTASPASPTDGRLYLDTSTVSAVSSAMRSACPGAGWQSSKVVGQNLTNADGAPGRDLFTYTCADATTSCLPGSPQLDQITKVALQAFVDLNPGKAPPETTLQSGVYLRNQNQAPVAALDPPLPVSGQARTYLFNASSSYDPEGRTLDYYWFSGTALPSGLTCTQLDSSADSLPGFLGRGITWTQTFAPGTQEVWLAVCDPGDRLASAPTASFRVS